jgi:hypothetical protein
MDTRTLISDPCTASPSGLRFPFFVVEAKSGGSTTMAEAENQAAVSGACALTILRTLRTLSGQVNAPIRDTSSTCLGPASLITRTFSLTTEGPTHTLWVNFQEEEEEESGSSMVWLGTYRITDTKSVRELVDAMASILSWGATEFKGWVEQSILGLLI